MKETFETLANRLAAQKPWLSWPEVCREPGKRRRKRTPAERRDSEPKKAKSYWWQE